MPFNAQRSQEEVQDDALAAATGDLNYDDANDQLDLTTGAKAVRLGGY